jgi:hypothetical protein
MNRSDEKSDDTNYQTLFAKNYGAVAAPTASLHFTPELFEALQKKWGGKRQGSGRPQTFPDERREILTGVRLPKWILDWLADQPNKGRVIEKALIETYQITRKGDDDAIR